MSRGFVKEEDQEETPVLVPRAHLPNGVPNYVTVNGLDELNKERDELLAEKKQLAEQETDNRVQINHITAKLNLLIGRINSAKVVEVNTSAQDEIHFGAKITLYKKDEDCTSEYQIVGVDEADIFENKISFLSPMAKALLNKKIGDEIILKTPKGDRVMQIKSIEY